MIGVVAAGRGQSARPHITAALCCALALATQTSWAARAITRVDVRPEADQTVVAVFTSDRQALEVKSFPLEGPARIVFDFHGAELDRDLPTDISTVAPALEGIRLGQFSVEPYVARLVVDLAEEYPEPEYEVKAGGEKGETLIVLRNTGPAILKPPTVEAREDAVLVRLPGVAHLRRFVATLQDPPRVYADLTDAVIGDAHRQQFEAGVLSEVRMGQQPADPKHPVARIVLELREKQAFSVFQENSDLVLAVAPAPWALPLPTYNAAGRLKGKRVVVDPGHGGDDIGAPAFFGRPPRGPFEKDIVLDIGHRLARLLEAEGADVTMTRKEDRTVSLQGRAAIANRRRAHALVSIHCNSCDVPNTLHGTSVFYDHAHSARFARLVQDELVAALNTKSQGVRNANFAVIRRTEGPGILVEAAYINHEGDRQRLLHPHFRERAARAILRGTICFLGDSSAGASRR